MNALTMQAKHLASRLYRYGGFSVDQDMESPKTGYMVSVYNVGAISSDNIDHVTTLIEEGITKLDSFNENLERKHYLGGWWNGSDGKMYIDLSICIQDKEEAIDLAKLHHQLAIYDLSIGEEIFL